MSNKKKYGISNYYLTAQKSLSKKYNSFENSYTLVCINNLIYTENCHIVARFKDFLYYDDDTEFLHKYFQKNELKKILLKVFNFYSKYCKVFPNYMVLPENEFLYRNLRKKQKLIDQFNEIKKEEEENRKHLKLKKNKDNENNYIIFSKKEQESIDKYKPSFTQSTIIMMDYLNFSNANNEKTKTKNTNDANNSKNSITISLNYNNINIDTDDINTSELTLISITNLINKSPTTTEKNSGNKNNTKLSFTPPKDKPKKGKININEQKSGNNNYELKKKYVSYYQNKKNGTSTNLTNANNNNNNIQVNNINNYNTNVTSKINNHKKEIIITSKKNSINNNTNSNNISQGKNSNNILISSITKTSKGKDSKNISKNIKNNITKKKLFTEKPISHKRPIYNYQNKKIEKNSNSINNNKYKKNFKEMISISFKPSISPPNTKINSLKLKIIDNLINNKPINKNANLKSNNNSNINNLSYIKKNNKNIKSSQNSNNQEKIEEKKNGDKKGIIKNNGLSTKIAAKENLKNYKTILRMNKTNHYSHDINKNHIIINKNTFTNFTEKTTFKNTSNDKIRKAEQSNKYISPMNKKYVTNNTNKNVKTPMKLEVKQNDNNFKKVIMNTKDGTQSKIQNYIKKILDKNNTKKEIPNNKKVQISK